MSCLKECECGKPDYLPGCTPDGCPLPPPRPLPPIPGCGSCPPPKPECGNHTPNYGLPLWKASDVTSWLMQMNGAMLRIDTIMHDLALRTGINGLPDDLVTCVSKLSQDMDVVKCTIGEISNKQANNDLLMQNLNTQFSAMKTDVASMQLSLTNFDTRLMTVDSANQQNKNDITLLKADLNMINSTLNSLQQNFTQYQQATNQTLAEHTTAIGELQTSAFVTNYEEVFRINSEDFSVSDFELVQMQFEDDHSFTGQFVEFVRLGGSSGTLWEIYIRDSNKNKVTINGTYGTAKIVAEGFNNIPALAIMSPFTIATTWADDGTNIIPITVKCVIRNNDPNPTGITVSLEYHIPTSLNGKQLTIGQTSFRVVGTSKFKNVGVTPMKEGE